MDDLLVQKYPNTQGSSNAPFNYSLKPSVSRDLAEGHERFETEQIYGVSLQDGSQEDLPENFKRRRKRLNNH